MEISMAVLKWRLRDLNPECHIEQDKRCISRIRFLYYEQHPLEPEALYVAGIHDDPTQSESKGTYMLLNRKSYLVFNDISVNELLNRVLKVFDFFNSWEHELLKLKAQKAPVSDFLSITDQVMQNPVAVSTPDFYVIGYTDNGTYEMDPVWRNMVENNTERKPLEEPYFNAITGKPVRELTSSPQLVRNVYPGGADVIMMYIMCNEERLGILTILTENTEMTEVDMQLASFFAEHLDGAKELLESAQIRPQAHLLQSLLDGEISALDVEDRVCSYIRPPWRLLYVSNTKRDDSISRKSLAARAERNQKCCMSAIYENGIILLISGNEFDVNLTSFTPLIDANLMNIGVSTPFSDLSDIGTVCQQVFYIKSNTRGNPGIYCFENYTIKYSMEMLRKNAMCEMLIHPAFHILEDYDRRNGSELLNTLKVYLRTELSSQKTAELLFLHPNSMKYRLKRIRELSGLTLTDGDELNRLRLSLWLSE